MGFDRFIHPHPHPCPLRIASHPTHCAGYRPQFPCARPPLNGIDEERHWLLELAARPLCIGTFLHHLNDRHSNRHGCSLICRQSTRTTGDLDILALRNVAHTQQSQNHEPCLGQWTQTHSFSVTFPQDDPAALARQVEPGRGVLDSSTSYRNVDQLRQFLRQPPQCALLRILRRRRCRPRDRGRRPTSLTALLPRKTHDESYKPLRVCIRRSVHPDAKRKPQSHCRFLARDWHRRVPVGLACQRLERFTQ